MKTTASVLLDVDVYTEAKAYSVKNGVSFSRFVQEVLCEFMDETLDPEKKAAIEKRIAKRPGRRANELPTVGPDDPRHPAYNDDE